MVGVDLGIKNLAVLSSGEQIPNPRHLSSALRKVRRLSRAASRRVGPYDADTKSRRPSSNRWRRSTAALGKAQGRVADQRKDAIHKLTTGLAKKYGTIVVEDLNVAGMVRNHCLARHVADASFGEIRRQLESVNGRGGQGVLALPVKRQPGTAQAGNTGTALPQGRAAVRELTNAH